MSDDFYSACVCVCVGGGGGGAGGGIEWWQHSLDL